MTERFKPLIYLLVLICLAINLLTLYTWDNSYVGNDGVQYLSTAKNWLAGNGFATDALMYIPHFQGVLPAAQTVWPPGYPLAIALTSLTGLELKTAALVFNLITHVTAALMMWLILLRMGVHRQFALLCAFLFYLMAKPWVYTTGLMTEPVFITLLLAATLVLPDPKRKGWLSWIVCGLLIALAIYVRYSAVFFALGAGTGIFVYLLLYERTSVKAFLINCSKIALLVIITIGAFGHLMYRTQALIGTLDRYSGIKQPETLASTTRLWLLNVSELLGFNAGPALNGKVSLGLFVAFIGIILILSGLFFTRKLHAKNKSVPEHSLDYFRLATIVISAHSAALIIYLTINSMSVTPLEIVNRYLYQIYPGLYAIVCFIIYALIKNSAERNSGRTGRALLCSIGALVLLYIIAQANELITSREWYLAEARTANEMMSVSVTKDTDLSSYISQCFENNQSTGSIWSTHGQHLHLHTGQPTVTHADIYTHNPFESRLLEQRIADYDIKMFVFVESPGKYEPHYSDYMAQMKDWLSVNQYSLLPIEHNQFGDNQSVTIYTEPAGCGI